MVKFPTQPALQNKVKPRTCTASANPSNFTDKTCEKSRLNGCIPKVLPFPKERLENAGLSHINGRDQLVDGNGAFVLTNINQLPTGGQVHKIFTNNPVFKAVLLGDMGSVTPARSEVFEQVSSMYQDYDQSSAFIFGLGDWLYPYGPLNDEAFEIARVKTSIIDAFAELSETVPKFGVLGNHEYGLSWVAADPEVFMNLANAANIQFPGRYYSLEIQGKDWALDCFALDSSTLACDPNQVAWFQQQVNSSKDKEIATEQKRWRIVMAHHPLISYGIHHGETTYLTDLMGASLADIDLYCCGHEHDLELITPAGKLPPILLSGTSSEIRTVKTGPDTSFQSSNYGFAEIKVNKDALGIQFHPAQGTQVLHEHQITRDTLT